MVNQLHRDTNHSARPLIGSINHGVDLQFLRRLRWVGWSLHVFQDGTGWPHSQVLQSGQARDDRVGHADAPGFIGSGTRQRAKGKNGNGTDSRLRGRSGVIVRVAVVLVRGGSAGLAYVNRGGDDHRQGGCDPHLTPELRESNAGPADVIRPDSVSRIRRFRSARISEAC